LGYHGGRDITRQLAELTLTPNGYGTRPTRDGYCFRKECERIFGRLTRRP